MKKQKVKLKLRTSQSTTRPLLKLRVTRVIGTEIVDVGETAPQEYHSDWGAFLEIKAFHGASDLSSSETKEILAGNSAAKSGAPTPSQNTSSLSSLRSGVGDAVVTVQRSSQKKDLTVPELTQEVKKIKIEMQRIKERFRDPLAAMFKETPVSGILSLEFFRQTFFYDFLKNSVSREFGLTWDEGRSIQGPIEEKIKTKLSAIEDLIIQNQPFKPLYEELSDFGIDTDFKSVRRSLIHLKGGNVVKQPLLDLSQRKEDGRVFSEIRNTRTKDLIKFLTDNARELEVNVDEDLEPLWRVNPKDMFSSDQDSLFFKLVEYFTPSVLEKLQAENPEKVARVVRLAQEKVSRAYPFIKSEKPFLALVEKRFLEETTVFIFLVAEISIFHQVFQNQKLYFLQTLLRSPTALLSKTQSDFIRGPPPFLLPRPREVKSGFSTALEVGVLGKKRTDGPVYEKH